MTIILDNFINDKYVYMKQIKSLNIEILIFENIFIKVFFK